MIDDLFTHLRQATTPAEIEVLQNGIWQHWLNTDDQAQGKLLEDGMRALSAENYTGAIQSFTALIELAPDYAEGWNKRATAYYLRGDYRHSLQDIAETLHREPRHFGALGGKASILRQLGAPRRALRVLRRLAAICPHLPGLHEQQLALREQLEENGEASL